MILVDTREPYKDGLADELVRFTSDFRVETLYHKADFIIEADGTELAIQRKEVGDFMGSINSLKDDLFELRSHYELTALLLEGNWKVDYSEDWNRHVVRPTKWNQQYANVTIEAMHNFILSQQMRGTMYVRAASMRETCMALSAFNDWVGPDMTAPVQNVEDAWALLLMLPGVGPATKEAIRGEYDSAFDAFMSIHEWSERVDGIGPATERKIIEWFTQ